MSCDSNRAKLFAALAPTVAPLVGSVDAAKAFLDTLYDVAASQPAPEGGIEQLAATAATTRMLVLAKNAHQLDLYPHTSGPRFPAPEAQQGWKAISDLLDAVERSTQLPPLAADCQHVAAFQNATDVRHVWAKQPAEGSRYWNEELKPETRQRLRHLWAADPERINALRRFNPERERVVGTLGTETHDAWLAEATELLLADRLLRPSWATAARHYLTLREADALTPEHRIRWGRFLAGVVGIGVGPRGLDGDPRSVTIRGVKDWQLCPSCGLASGKGTTHIFPCKPVEVALATRAAQVVAQALAHPDFAHIEPDPSPFVTAERIYATWMQTGQPDPPEGPLAGVIAVLREHDSRMVMWLKQCYHFRYSPLQPEQIDERALADATIRSPIYFERKPYIWENGRLYPQEEYRRRADFGRWVKGGGDLLAPEDHAACYAEVDTLTMARVMMGEGAWRDEIRVPGRAPDPPQRRRSAQAVWQGEHRVHELLRAPEAPDVV